MFPLRKVMISQALPLILASHPSLKSRPILSRTHGDCVIVDNKVQQMKTANSVCVEGGGGAQTKHQYISKTWFLFFSFYFIYRIFFSFLWTSISLRFNRCSVQTLSPSTRLVHQRRYEKAFLDTTGAQWAHPGLSFIVSIQLS